jgi:hypothetical protein
MVAGGGAARESRGISSTGLWLVKASPPMDWAAYTLGY